MMLGEFLIADGVLDQDGLQEALDWQVLYGGRLGTNLLELKLIDEAALGRALSKRLGVEVVIGELTIDASLLGAIPKQLCDREEILPWKIEKRRLKLLCAEPKVEVFDELAVKLQRACVPVVAPEFRIINALRAFYGAKRQMRALDFGVVPAEQLEERRRKKKKEAGLGAAVEAAPELIDESAFNDIYNQIVEGRAAGGRSPSDAPLGVAATTGAAAAPPVAEEWTPAPVPLLGVWPAGTALPPGYVFAAPTALPPGFAVPPGYIAIVPFSSAPPPAPPPLVAQAPAAVAAKPPPPPTSWRMHHQPGYQLCYHLRYQLVLRPPPSRRVRCAGAARSASSSSPRVASRSRLRRSKPSKRFRKTPSSRSSPRTPSSALTSRISPRPLPPRRLGRCSKSGLTKSKRTCRRRLPPGPRRSRPRRS